MGLFSGFNFPWTDLHTLNLDWLLRSVKSLLDRYNPVAKSEDMTQPVGVDGEGKLFTAPGEPSHADGTNYGTVNPVSTSPDMTQPVGVDASGKLYTAPGGGSAAPPHADGTNYGTVNPVSSSPDMTQPVGVDESGKLFTKPGGDTVTKTLLYTIGDTVVAQSSSNVALIAPLSDTFDQLEFVVASEFAGGETVSTLSTRSFIYDYNGLSTHSDNFLVSSYDSNYGPMWRSVFFRDVSTVNFGTASPYSSTGSYSNDCHVLAIYGIKKGEA